MAKQKMVCHICDFHFKVKDPGTEGLYCPGCGADLEHPEQEFLEKSSSCSYVQGTLKVTGGSLYLTNQRLIWVKDYDGSLAASAGLVGALVATAMNKGAGQAAINIELSQLAGVEDYKKGLGKGLTIQTKEGTAYNLLPHKPQEWREILEDCLANPS